MLLPLLLAPPLAYVAYSWGAHLGTLGCVWRGRRSWRRIALTFDDGPDPEFTPRVLELLDRAGVPGTFFLIGERAARAPDVVRATTMIAAIPQHSPAIPYTSVPNSSGAMMDLISRRKMSLTIPKRAAKDGAVTPSAIPATIPTKIQPVSEILLVMTRRRPHF